MSYLKGGGRMFSGKLCSVSSENDMERHFRHSAGIDDLIAERHALSEAADRIFRARSVREDFLPMQTFGEPAWDILLLLYIEFDRSRRMDLTSISAAANVPASSLIRWIAFLESEGLVSLSERPTEAKPRLAELTEKGASAMDQCLAAMLKLPAIP